MKEYDALNELAMKLTPPGGRWAVREALGRLIDNPELLAVLSREAGQRKEAAPLTQKGSCEQ